MKLQELEQFKIKLYKEFHENNKKLYLKDCLMYAHNQRLYVEKELEKIKAEQN